MRLTTTQKIFHWGVLAFLAVLSISGTIALRNVLHLALLVILCASLLFAHQQLKVAPAVVLRWVPAPLFIWIVFLVLFPLWAVQSDVAWFNFRGQWLESILTWVLAYGAIVMLGRNGPSLWVLAWVSAAPIVLHLLLCLAAWGGLLSDVFYAAPSLLTVWKSIQNLATSPSHFGWMVQPFPFGFRGVEPMHGNIGYAACQSIALASVCICMAWRDGDKRRLVGAVVLVFLCFASVVIAASRGAVYFGFLLLMLSMVLFVLMKHQTVQHPSPARNKVRAYAFGLVGVVAVVFFTISVHSFLKDDVRWYSMLDKVELGFENQNPIKTLCDGVSKTELDKIYQRYADRDPTYAQELVMGLEVQDGGRILLMRSGLQLVLENPRGLDGSRQSYEKLMAEKCGQRPHLSFAHAHQAWINLALALGWMGCLLFATLMLHMLGSGLRHLKDTKAWFWAFALVMISVFWIARGFTDAVYQEHYLQMQAFILLYLVCRMKYDSNSAGLKENVAKKT